MDKKPMPPDMPAALEAVCDAACRWHSAKKKNRAKRIRALRLAVEKIKSLGWWAQP